ncbi:tenascin-like, partial [Haliotis rubra]|uniref:tenascin-like n=1 Tax=Haliotis rubra TaxID=36100 RepID=UPI001EE596B0
MAVATAMEQCGRKVMMNATAAAKAPAANGTTASQWEQFQKVSCVNECSHRGTCVEGECQCEAGYGASDCSVDITEPPRTFGLKEDGVCDVTSRTCNVSHMLTEHIVQNGFSNCRTRSFE